jgi:hypothetical protein
MSAENENGLTQTHAHEPDYMQANRIAAFTDILY